MLRSRATMLWSHGVSGSLATLFRSSGERAMAGNREPRLRQARARDRPRGARHPRPLRQRRICRSEPAADGLSSPKLEAWVRGEDVDRVSDDSAMAGVLGVIIKHAGGQLPRVMGGR